MKIPAIPVGLSWKRTAKSNGRFTKGQAYKVLKYNPVLDIAQIETENGYTKVSIRYNAGYNVEIVAVKTAKGYWKKI